MDGVVLGVQAGAGGVVLVLLDSCNSISSYLIFRAPLGFSFFFRFQTKADDDVNGVVHKRFHKEIFLRSFIFREEKCLNITCHPS